LHWFKERAPELDPTSHLAAVTSQPARAAAFGIDPTRVFTFPEWVGGRYSLWSACGLGIAIAHGQDAFRELLAGAAELDAHFARAPLEANLPVLLGMLGCGMSILGRTHAGGDSLRASAAAAAVLPSAARDGEPGQAG